MFNTGILGSRSWTDTRSQKHASVAASARVKNLIAGTVSMRSSTTRRVASSQ